MADGLLVPDLTNLPVIVKKFIVPLFEVAGKVWDTCRQLISGKPTEGTYEVLDYVIKLKLVDPEGKKAQVFKREKVKYLQNNIIAFQDQAWGDGKILQNYRCTPGVPVDKYRTGYKTLILISLREIKNRGDIDEFNIQWGISQGFMSPTGFWATDINHKTDMVKVEVDFPPKRPPLKISVLEKNLQKINPISKDSLIHLADGRWQLDWEQLNPRQYEQYILRWEW